MIGLCIWWIYALSWDGLYISSGLMASCYLSIFNVKLAEMRRPMDFWKGMVGFSLSFFFLSTIPWLILRVDGCTTRDPRWLPCLFGICIRMYTPSFLFSFLLTIYIPVPPRAIYPTTRIPRRYQVYLPRCLCVYFVIIMTAIVHWQIVTANVPILLTGIVEAGLFGNIGISELFLSLRGGCLFIDHMNLRNFL